MTPPLPVPTSRRMPPAWSPEAQADLWSASSGSGAEATADGGDQPGGDERAGGGPVDGAGRTARVLRGVRPRRRPQVAHNPAPFRLPAQRVARLAEASPVTSSTAADWLQDAAPEEPELIEQSAPAAGTAVAPDSALAPAPAPEPAAELAPAPVPGPFAADDPESGARWSVVAESDDAAADAVTQPLARDEARTVAADAPELVPTAPTAAEAPEGTGTEAEDTDAVAAERERAPVEAAETSVGPAPTLPGDPERAPSAPVRPSATATPGPSAPASAPAPVAPSAPGTLRAALDLLAPHLTVRRRAVLTGWISLVLGVGLVVALPVPLGSAVDAARGTGSDGIGLPLALFGGLVVLAVAARLVASAALGRAGAGTATALRSRLLRHLHALTPSRTRDARSAAEDVGPLTRDADALRDLVTHAGPRLVGGLLTVVPVLGVTAIFAPSAALVLLGTAVLAALLSVLTARRTVAAERAAALEQELLAATAEELATAATTVQSYGLETRSERGLAEAGLRAGRALTRARRSVALDRALQLLAAVAGASGLLAVLAPQLASGAVTPGELVLLLGELLVLVLAVGPTARALPALRAARTAAARIGALLARPTGIAEPERIQRLEQVRGEIVYSAITTHARPAPGHDPARLFDAVSLVVPAGQHLALLDEAGEESAALLAYLLRFEEPDTGRVLLDRYDTRAVSLVDLRRQIAVVQREPVLFTDTMRENIRIGLPGATDREVAEAAARVGLDELAATLPYGVDTVLGRDGHPVTDGQRRRIAIARALLRDAPVVVLDGADAELAATERESVLAALRTLTAGRTALVISREAEAVRAADRVLWLEDGEVLEDGSPAALETDPSGRVATWLRARDEDVR
ncbi:ABC transporter transmembrane domain-containing protein [Brachybacterium sp. J144]|uniref:ABC transporter transmembrane domain-containing protein n=1 Tax=Brachybacterium sp. J144 TaxID=3116487 RepID=UPI002E77D263|nr:ABC transporter transmembrane domain-containing protein [Brachybacterium sp. J144]MEE1650160.1 ABC transporter transmembrane domain-containing protein [Brachybacterium sp. J144]